MSISVFIFKNTPVTGPSVILDFMVVAALTVIFGVYVLKLTTPSFVNLSDIFLVPATL